MFDLPEEIQQKIFEYDSTYKYIYDKVIKEINKFGEFISYDKNFECYFFYISKTKGIYIYRTDYSNNYKKALKNTLRRPLF